MKTVVLDLKSSVRLYSSAAFILNRDERLLRSRLGGKYTPVVHNSSKQL